MKEQFPTEILNAAETILAYHQMGHSLTPSDCIFGFGTNDDRVAVRVAEVYHLGLAPLVVFSGAVGVWTAGLYDTTEAEHFARIAIDHGVPKSAILLEPQATNTGENVTFSKELLKQRGIKIERAIVVQKAYMERRSYATFKNFWPEPDVLLTSPKLALAEFARPHLSLREVINIMVGDLDRIRVYPALGFQIYQEIPTSVMDAMEFLIASGFDKHLVPQRTNS